MKKHGKLILVDSYNMLHIGANLYPFSTFKESNYNFKTGGIHYLCSFLFRKDIKPEDTVCFCFDTMSFRSIQNEHYKSNRARQGAGKRLSILFQAELSMTILYLLGCNVFKVNGLEADDLIYSLKIKYGGAEQFASYPIIVYSTDRDLSILVDNRTELKSTSSTVPSINISNYVSMFNNKPSIQYNTIALYKALNGDKSDCISPSMVHLSYEELLGIATDMGYSYSNLSDYSKLAEFILSNKTLYYEEKVAIMDNLNLVMLRYVDLHLPSQSCQDIKSSIFVNRNSHNIELLRRILRVLQLAKLSRNLGLEWKSAYNKDYGTIETMQNQIRLAEESGYYPSRVIMPTFK